MYQLEAWSNGGFEDTLVKPVDDPRQSLSRKKRRTSESVNVDVNKRDDDNSSDTDSDEDQAQKNISIITDTIGGTVTRLFRLSNAIRKSAKAHKTGEYRYGEEANKAITDLRLYTEDYIRFRFPRTPEPLRSALVGANALRLRRFYYQRSHRKRIALSVQRPHVDSISVQLPKIPDSAVYTDSTVESPRAKSVLVNNKLSFPPVPTTSECLRRRCWIQGYHKAHNVEVSISFTYLVMIT